MTGLTRRVCFFCVEQALKSGTKRALEDEKLTPDFYSNFLTTSFLILVPLGFVVTVFFKVRSLRAVRRRWNEAMPDDTTATADNELLEVLLAGLKPSGE